MVPTFFKKLLLYSAGHTYSNLSRLFIRLFVGIMFMQFGIRQMANYDFFSEIFPSMFGMGSEMTLVVMIVIELLFSALVIFGFITRIAAVPPMISMVAAEYYLLDENHDAELVGKATYFGDRFIPMFTMTNLSTYLIKIRNK